MTSGFSAFAQLIRSLGIATKTNDKLKSLVHYFQHASDQDKIWLVALFTGRRPKRSIKTSLLTQWCIDISTLSPWLFAECYHTVGDLSETIALLIQEDIQQSFELTLSETIVAIQELSHKTEKEQFQFISATWKSLNKDERFVFNKLITGNFRIGVSDQLIIQAIAVYSNKEASTIAHRISGKWDPFTTTFASLIEGNGISRDPSKPYPFFLAYALEGSPESLGDPHEWQAEWKWDGIRGQIIKRENEMFIWSRGEELMTDRFPELHALGKLPNGLVIDGEILCLEATAFGHWKPLPFSALQTRIGRKTISKKILQDSPVGFIAYDLLEFEGEDWREKPLSERRKKLESICENIHASYLQLSPILNLSNWHDLEEQRESARENGSEGLMLKRKNSIYQTGRKRGDWYKWKIDPLTIDGVMIYAQKGHGRRSNLFTDYTFAVRDGDQLVSFAKAYSGLSDAEFAEVDAFVKRNAIEKFGPVRTVKPELVFEIAFEGIAASSRHKSGVALRFPRINRWRKDKPASEINTLSDLKKLLELYGK